MKHAFTQEHFLGRMKKIYLNLFKEAECVEDVKSA